MQRHFSRETIAQILVEATIYGVQKTAEKYRIKPRQLRVWRTRMHNDLDLQELYNQALQAHQKRWVEEAGKFLSQGFTYLQEASRTQVSSPEMIHAIAGALKIANEIILTQEILNAKFTQQNRDNDSEN